MKALASKTCTTLAVAYNYAEMEGLNRTLGRLLKAFANNAQIQVWDICLERCLLVCRATVHTSMDVSSLIMLQWSEM